jgi:hypothetical protein
MGHVYETCYIDDINELLMFCRNIDSFLFRHISSTPYIYLILANIMPKFSMLLITCNLINFSAYISTENHDDEVDREEEDFR